MPEEEGNSSFTRSCLKEIEDEEGEEDTQHSEVYKFYEQKI